MVNKVHQSQIILHLLEKAAARHARNPAQNPTELAMEEARRQMEHWFEGMLGRRERLMVSGLLSLVATNAPERWPRAFLSETPPAEFLHEMQESEVRAGPDLEVSSMAPRPIDVTPLLDPLHLSDAWEKLKWGPAALALVVVIAALSVSLFMITR